MSDATDPLAALARLHTASRALAEATGVEAVSATLVERALDMVDAAGAVVVLPRADRTLEVLASSYNRDQVAMIDSASIDEKWPLTDALRTGEPVWLSSRAELELAYPGLRDTLKSDAWIALPLRAAGRIVGALGIGFSSPQVFEEHQRIYLLALADICAVVLDRHVLEARRSEHRLRALVDANKVGVIAGDITVIREANDAFLNMLGLTADDLARGIKYRAITPAEYREADDRLVASADETGRFGPYEKEFFHSDGHRVPIRIVGAVVSNEGRGRFIALVEDQSTTRATEAELRAGEARYQSLVEATNTIVWSADWSGDFVAPNPTWASYTGQTFDDAHGHGWLDAFHPDDRTRVFASLDEARRNRRTWYGRARLYHAASNTHRATALRAVPLMDEAGELLEWVGTVTDVDDQVRTEDVLRATSARLASLMRNAPVGFAFIDDELRFQVVNDKLAEINGLPVEAHLGRDVREIVPDMAEVNESLFRRVLGGEPILEAEVTGSTAAAPDERRDWLVNYYPVRDNAGTILGIGATVTDVTERNRLLAAERAARASAEGTAQHAEALSGVTAAVANARDDAAIARVAGEHLVAALGADGVLVARSDAAGRTDEILHASGYSPADIEVIRGAPEPRRRSTAVAISNRAPMFFEDTGEYLAQFADRAPMVDALGAKAWVIVPLVAADHVLGFIIVMFRTERTFATDERRFIATLGDVVAQAMLRARARVAEALARRSTELLTEVLAAERTRLAAVLHRMPAGLVVVDLVDDGTRVVLSNRRATEILGPPPNEDTVDAWFGLRTLDGLDIPADESPVHRALRGEEVAEAEDAFVVRRDDTTVRVRLGAVPIRDTERRITSAVLVVEDVTEQARRERDAQLLAGVSDLLDAKGDVNQTIERVVGVAVPSFADACAAYVIADDGLQLLAVAHRDPERAIEIRALLDDTVAPERFNTPIAAAVRRGSPVLISPVPDDTGPDTAERSRVRELLNPTSFLVVPLRTGERISGALVFCQTADTGREFTADDVDVATELATRCALLLQQVVAHMETARARDRADRLQRFATAMSRAASVDGVADAIADEGVKAVGAFVVNVAMRVEHDTSFEFVQTRRLRPTSRISWHRIDPKSDDALAVALRSGQPSFYPNVASYAAEFPGTESVLELAEANAVAVLPLYGSAGRVIGAIGYTFAHEQPFDADQRALLETVADVAAQSLDRARLYERERDVAGALQLALLPSALPELDDVVTEARYVAGGAGVSVGGDWYDVLRFADGRVGLLIGDAAGRGVEAATLMGKVRHAAAALAMDHDSPAAVLARVNEYLHTIVTRRSMVTCCYIVLDHDRGTLTYASAGHPPPVVVELDGEPRFLDQGRGVPLGVIPTAAYSDAHFQLTAATTIVLYTDGLIERRGETIDEGLQRLLDGVRGHDTDVNELCDHLTSTLLQDSSEDDVALLATRVGSVPDCTRLDLELPADSRRLHELRARVGRWLVTTRCDAAVIPDIVVALNEAASNSMLHAYAGAERRGMVNVSLVRTDDALTATVTDHGHWRNARDNHDGRGMEMMHALMTAVDIDRSDDGTRITLTRTLTPEMSA